MGSMAYVRCDGPEAIEVRYGPRRSILRPGDELRVYATCLTVTPIPEAVLRDDLNFGAKPVTEPCRIAEE